MELLLCTVENVPLLAQLNKQLYEDEQNDNIPTIDILEEKMRCSMEQGSKAYLFIEEGETAGYALVKTQISPNYLSHFFICRSMRKKQLGTIAFNLLMNDLNINSIDLDVFCWNQRGQEFWKSLGFQERCIIMRKYK